MIRIAALILLAALPACTREAGAPPGQGGPVARIAALDASLGRSQDPVVRFAFDSAALDARARAQLVEVAVWMAANPDAALRVTGHADLAGPDAYNRRLGLRRARAVEGALIAAGVDPRRVLGVASAGEAAPVVPRRGPEPRNRRAVIEVAWIGRVPLDLRAQAGGEGFGMDGVRAQAAHDIYQNPLGTPVRLAGGLRQTTVTID
ncbi:MAG: OmpA family protein [Paracoccaceae bacterium]